MNLFDSLHEIMLISFTELLNLRNELLVLLALYANCDRKPAHAQGRRNAEIFGQCLQSWYV